MWHKLFRRFAPAQQQSPMVGYTYSNPIFPSFSLFLFLDFVFFLFVFFFFCVMIKAKRWFPSSQLFSYDLSPFVIFYFAKLLLLVLFFGSNNNSLIVVRLSFERRTTGLEMKFCIWNEREPKIMRSAHPHCWNCRELMRTKK
jgi:hypothetical protein